MLSRCCLIWTENVSVGDLVMYKDMVGSQLSVKQWKNKHLLDCDGVVMSSFDMSSPLTSCLYWLMTCVRLSLACKISAVSGKNGS